MFQQRRLFNVSLSSLPNEKLLLNLQCVLQSEYTESGKQSDLPACLRGEWGNLLKPALEVLLLQNLGAGGAGVSETVVGRGG